MWLATSNQSALFHRSEVMLKYFYDIDSRHQNLVIFNGIIINCKICSALKFLPRCSLGFDDLALGHCMSACVSFWGIYLNLILIFNRITKNCFVMVLKHSLCFLKRTVKFIFCLCNVNVSCKKLIKSFEKNEVRSLFVGSPVWPDG